MTSSHEWYMCELVHAIGCSLSYWSVVEWNKSWRILCLKKQIIISNNPNGQWLDTAGICSSSWQKHGVWVRMAGTCIAETRGRSIPEYGGGCCELPSWFHCVLSRSPPRAMAFGYLLTQAKHQRTKREKRVILQEITKMYMTWPNTFLLHVYKISSESANWFKVIRGSHRQTGWWSYKPSFFFGK
jgi:hypothetical protein